MSETRVVNITKESPGPDSVYGQTLDGSAVQKLVKNGARYWDEGKTLLLLTPKQLDQLENGTVLKSISGDYVTVGKDKIDRDIRAGVLAFGVVLPGDKAMATTIEAMAGDTIDNFADTAVNTGIDGKGTEKSKRTRVNMIFKINIGNNGIHPFLVITTDGKEAKTTVEKLVLNKLKKFVNKFNEEQSDEA